MGKLIQITPDVLISEKSVTAVVKNVEENAINGIVVKRVAMWVYIKNCQIPIVIQSESEVEVLEILEKLKENASV